MKTTTRIVLGVGMLMSVAACDMNQGKEPPKFGSLTRQLLVVDSEGRRYGTLEMDPVNGGRMFDAEGRLVGTLVTPAVTSTVTTTTPTVPVYPQ